MQFFLFYLWFYLVLVSKFSRFFTDIYVLTLK